MKQHKKEPIEYMDPITGELSRLVPDARRRIRDVFIDALGREIPDPTPMAPPIGYTRAPSMIDIVREQIKREMALYASDREVETFEDADDFNVDDDVDPSSPWENDFDPPWSEVRAAVEADREERAKKAVPPASAASSSPASAAPFSGASAVSSPEPGSEPGGPAA